MNRLSTFDQLLKDPRFSNINPKKLQMIKEMFTLMESKTNDQKIQVLFAYGLKMKQSGMQLTSEESKSILSVMKKNLSLNEQRKFDMMIQMMEMMKA